MLLTPLPLSQTVTPSRAPPSLSHFVTHPRTPQKVRHTSRTAPIFSKPSTTNPDKSPLYKFSLNCSWGFLSGGFRQSVFWLEGFVRGGFCTFPLLSEYNCYNRKLNITLNFMFHMYDKKFISMTSHALDPPPPVTNCHTFSDPLLPSSVTYFMDGPIVTTETNSFKLLINSCCLLALYFFIQFPSALSPNQIAYSSSLTWSIGCWNRNICGHCVVAAADESRAWDDATSLSSDDVDEN